MQKLRRFIWYLASRLFLILAVVSLCVVTIYYAMNATNIYIVLKDGMAKRAQVIMMDAPATDLTKFFQGGYLQRDENLQLAIDGKSPYSYYTVRGIDHRLSMTWMWCWPWDSTARVTFTAADRSLAEVTLPSVRMERTLRYTGESVAGMLVTVLPLTLVVPHSV